MVRASWSKFVVVVLVCAFAVAAAPASAAPDLKVAYLNALTDGVPRSGPFAAKTRVKNTGDDRAGRSRTSYALSTDRRRGDDVAIDTRWSFGSLAVGRSQRRNAKLAPPAFVLGRFYLIACADAGDAVDESNERNNCRIARGPIAVTLTAIVPGNTGPNGNGNGTGATGGNGNGDGGNSGGSGTPGSGNPGTGSPGGGTPPAPVPLSTPTGLTASSPSADQIDVTWNAVPEATSYTVERADAAGGPFTQLGTPTGTAFNDTGLVGGETWFYRVTAHGTRPDSAPSDTERGLTRPAAPTSLATTGVMRTQLDLGWNQSKGADGYRVYRSASAFGPFDLIDTTTGAGATQSASNPSALAPGTDFVYVVRAFNASGESADSASITQVTAPAQPAAPSPTANGPTSVTVDWPDVATATGYRLLRSSGVGNPFTDVGTPGASSFDDTTVAATETYAYKVVAVGGGGESPESDAASVTTPPAGLAAPTGLGSSSPTFNRIDLTWNGVGGATEYMVQRGDNAAGPFTNVGTTASTTFADAPSLQGGTNYFYRVIARAPGAQSNPSAVGTGLTRPVAPVNLHKVSAQLFALHLGWDQVTGASGYRVYRAPALGGGPFMLVDTVNGGANNGSVTDPSTLASSSFFSYYVTAFNASGESTNSGTIDQITPPPAPSLTATPLGPTSALVDWDGVLHAQSYVVTRRAGATGTPVEIANTSDILNTHFTDTTASPNTPYFYEVRGVNDGGAGRSSGGALATTDHACDNLNNTTRATAHTIGAVDGDEPGTSLTYNGVVCRGEQDWLRFRVDETNGNPLDPEALEATIDFSPGANLNGKVENIRMCVVDAFGTDLECSPYGVTTVTPPPFFFTGQVDYPDGGGDRDFFLRFEGDVPASNNVYSITITGDP